MAEFSRENGGLLTEDDLAGFQVREEAAPHVTFGNCDVHGCGPWSQGPVFLETLGILEYGAMAQIEPNSADAVHLIVEALKLAFADRERYCGDPRFVDVPMDRLLSPDYLRRQWARIDPARAAPKMPSPGEIPGFTRTGDTGVTAPAGSEIPGTSYVGVIDRDGNIFSATPSDGYSQGPVIPGLGLHLSERGAQSSLDRENPNAVAPGKRPRLTPNPALVLRDGRALMALGSPGNERQPQAMAQVLLDMMVWGMNPQEAVEQPRFASYSFPASSFPHRYEPGKLRIEEGIGDTVAAELARRGHDVERWPRWSWSAGGVCVVMRDQKAVFAGGADPRREGYVATF
jgi:gamma-glutamyltranspeptidase/glutathione hydrolase